MADLNTFEQIKAWVLSQADEINTGSAGTLGVSDWDDEAETAIGDCWRDFCIRWPWLSLRKNPPGAFLTAPPITDVTVTVAAGLGVTATLSTAPTVDITGYKAWFGQTVFRVLTHTAATDTCILDAVPEALTAQALTFYKDEYDLNSDLGLFIDGLWTPERSNVIPLWSEERVKAEFPEPGRSSGWPSEAFTRIGQTRIRLSHYPSVSRRLEYPYAVLPPIPSATGDRTDTLVLAEHLRPVLALGSLATFMDIKSDGRAAKKRQDYEFRIERVIGYETRLLHGLASPSGNRATRGAYA